MYKILLSNHKINFLIYHQIILINKKKTICHNMKSI